MIYKLDIRRPDRLVSRVTELFMDLHGKVFRFVGAVRGVDASEPLVRLACDLRPGAVFQNTLQLNLAATDGVRFEFEITENDVAAMEDVLQGNETLLAPAVW